MIIDTLKDCGRKIELRFPHINIGGCCVYAAAVASNLESKGITAWGIVVDHKVANRNYYQEDIHKIKTQNNPSTPKQWNGNGVEFWHVLVQFEFHGKIWTHDTTRTTTNEKDFTINSDYDTHKGYLDIPDLVLLASDTYWNNKFDRSQIPKLVREIWMNLRRR